MRRVIPPSPPMGIRTRGGRESVLKDSRNWQECHSYSIRNDWFDLLLLYGIGLVGFLMRRYDIPMAPTIVGMILGPLAEQQLRRALAISQGDFSIFVTKPICLAAFALVLLVLVVPPLWKRYGARLAPVSIAEKPR